MSQPRADTHMLQIRICSASHPSNPLGHFTGCCLCAAISLKPWEAFLTLLFHILSGSSCRPLMAAGLVWSQPKGDTGPMWNGSLNEIFGLEKGEGSQRHSALKSGLCLLIAASELLISMNPHSKTRYHTEHGEQSPVICQLITNADRYVWLTKAENIWVNGWLHRS